MTVDVSEPGLRERKRRATERAIQVAVLELVGDKGLDRVTVDEISRSADVSPRTFFNYFSSKESALVGEGPVLPDDEAVQEFAHAGPGADLFDGLRALLVAAAELSTQDVDLTMKRRRILGEYPQLFAMRMATVHQFENQLEGVVARRLVLDHPERGKDPAALARDSRLIVLVTMAALRHASGLWLTSDPHRPLGELVAESFASLRTVLTTSAH